ncbi:universal stress protein [Massilia norwichensis]|uniref:Universal stress protein n=1 Tax=Massilia norwichensis TaxID=1442366 RepID=A0ABT2A6A1_9BURK|nr:universal stress protein [Massilia norwichensis]MCS0589674.1 universal stress protein [Massilia norwichensis]
MFKTIVVHVDGSPLQDSRLRAAACLANAHDAHLVGSAATGLSPVEYAFIEGSLGAPVPPSDFVALRESSTAHLDAFAEQARRLGVASVETRLIEDHADYGLLLQSRYADLVVLSRNPDDSGPVLPGHLRRLPEQLALRGARPVLVVPDSYRDEAIPGIAVAAWDGSMQALRALTAALPLLQSASAVKLVLVNPDTLSELHGEQPGADMALYLARHGVEVEVVVEYTRTTVGHALMSLARDCGAGLLVCGAYGHSRYREWVLGGVTRELLARAPLPLLVAH